MLDICRSYAMMHQRELMRDRWVLKIDLANMART